MNEILKNYLQAQAAVCSLFNTDIYHNIVVVTDQWSEEYGEVTYGQDGEEYSFDIFHKKVLSKCKQYVLYVGDDGCGNRDAYVLDNSKRVAV